MSRKIKTHASEKTSAVRRAPEPSARSRHERAQQTTPSQAFERALNGPRSTLAPTDILALQRAVGNRAVRQLLCARLNQPDSSSSVQISPPQTLPLQASTSVNAIQRQTEEEPPQEKSETVKKKENRTGLPDNLKAGIENLSGLSLDDVTVHRNSPKPAEVQALAYTQGTNIHLGPGAEEHLPHEAWHVVQQKQGRVEPTLQAKGLPINDDQGLEREADVMGAKAKQHGRASFDTKALAKPDIAANAYQSAVVQRVPQIRDVNPPTGLAGLHYTYYSEIGGNALPSEYLHITVEYDETVNVGRGRQRHQETRRRRRHRYYNYNAQTWRWDTAPPTGVRRAAEGYQQAAINWARQYYLQDHPPPPPPTATVAPNIASVTEFPPLGRAPARA
jgi:hypothetical protein